jgi:two-component system NtrC family response regulator
MHENRIPIADDEEAIRRVLANIFKGTGFRVYEASDGEEAIHIARLRPVDVAVVDIQMPGMDGIEVLKKIKKIDPAIEVLIITGNANPESLRSTIVENGAFDYIIKPFFKVELINTVQNALLKRSTFWRTTPSNGK